MQMYFAIKFCKMIQTPDFLCCIIISVFMLLFIPQQFPEPTKHDFHKTKIFVNKSKYLWKQKQQKQQLLCM